MTELKPARVDSRSPSSEPEPGLDDERRRRPNAPRDGHDVAVQLRRLTLLAHRAIRDEPGRTLGPRPLCDVRSALLDLEVAVTRLELNGLGDYVASLRRRVESALSPPNTDRRSAAVGASYSTKFQNRACP